MLQSTTITANYDKYQDKIEASQCTVITEIADAQIGWKLVDTRTVSMNHSFNRVHRAYLDT